MHAGDIPGKSEDRRQTGKNLTGLSTRPENGPGLVNSLNGERHVLVIVSGIRNGYGHGGDVCRPIPVGIVHRRRHPDTRHHDIVDGIDGAGLDVVNIIAERWEVGDNVSRKENIDCSVESLDGEGA